MAKVSAISQRLIHPYDDFGAGVWAKGNLHTHTTASDGRCPMQEVIDDYAGRGYDFLMFSDHDILSSYEGEVDPKGLVLIPGNEITGGGSHMLHVNATELLDPFSGRQPLIKEASTDTSLVVLCHPNWTQNFDHWPIDTLRELEGYDGVEVYNGVVTVLHGSPYSTNKWDILLSSGRRVWGFANDDSHAPGHVGLGWNMVKVPAVSVSDVVAGMRRGSFYASTGVTISNIEVDGMRIRVETKDAQRIVALHQVGARFAVADEHTIEVDVPDHAEYVRFECWGPGESFAWTQPFFVER